MSIHILQNIVHEGPGLIGKILSECQIPFVVHQLDNGDPLPAVDDVSGLIVMGGPDSANDENAKIQSELTLIAECLDREIPYFGVCLGLQLAVKVKGGCIVPNAVPEIGWRDRSGNLFMIEKTAEGKKHTLLESVADPFPIFHIHGETVELTESMRLLGTGTDCHHQVVEIQQNAIGFQGHIELTDNLLNDWLHLAPELADADSIVLKKDHCIVQSEYEKTGQQILMNFFRMTGFL